jgi:hypothetical protein
MARALGQEQNPATPMQNSPPLHPQSLPKDLVGKVITVSASYDNDDLKSQDHRQATVAMISSVCPSSQDEYKFEKSEQQVVQPKPVATTTRRSKVITPPIFQQQQQGVIKPSL